MEKLGYRGPQVLCEAIERAAPGRRFAHVLDLGCGAGLFAAAIVSRAEKITGVDLSPAMIEQARAKGFYERLAAADLTDFLAAEPAESADLAAAADVFVYVGDLGAVFAGVFRTLRPGGLFAFTTQSGPSQGFAVGDDLRFSHSESYLRELARRSTVSRSRNFARFRRARTGASTCPAGLRCCAKVSEIAERRMDRGARPALVLRRSVFQQRVSLMKKVYPDAGTAMAGLVKDGMTLMAGGFGLCGIPEALIEAVKESGAKNLTFISNNAGVDGIGLGVLLETRQVKKMISSYVGENKLFAQQFLGGELEIEFNPQGTLAERIRAGGAGVPAFYTKTGFGTLVAEGKETRVFNGENYVMETGLTADVALVHAWMGDHEGNLIFRKTARNFNPMMATAGKITVAQVEHLVPAGQLNPDHIHTPGIYVKRIVHVPNAAKHIEQRTTRKHTSAAAATGGEV